MSMFSGMRWNGWELVGLIGQAMFFARMIAQWVASEKVRKPVIPVIYWYLSLVGAGVMIAYAFHIGSFAILIPQFVGLVFYSRSLSLEYVSRKREALSAAAGPARIWPSLSVVVPVFNEEKGLASTLAALVEQQYQGRLEIIAALNGCTDASRSVAEQFPVRIVEDSRSGMSFGKNLGGRAAVGNLLVFVDADTRLPPGALALLAEATAGIERYAGSVAGKPERGGGVVRVCFFIANMLTRHRKAQTPGGVMFMDRETFTAIGGLDESLPQGTSTDCIWRGLEAGARYVYVNSFHSVTSIRRFEKKGIIQQMFDWRRNHRALKNNRRHEVKGKTYENFR